MAYDLTKPYGRFMAYMNMQLEDHGIVRSIYNNFYALPGGMYRCSQPSPAQIRKYHRRYGIKTIINLRGENPHGSYDLEVDTCRELGIELINFNLYSRDMPSVEEVLGARDLFERRAVFPGELPALLDAQRCQIMHRRCTERALKTRGERSARHPYGDRKIAECPGMAGIAVQLFERRTNLFVGERALPTRRRRWIFFEIIPQHLIKQNIGEPLQNQIGADTGVDLLRDEYQQRVQSVVRGNLVRTDKYVLRQLE